MNEPPCTHGSSVISRTRSSTIIFHSLPIEFPAPATEMLHGEAPWPSSFLRTLVHLQFSRLSASGSFRRARLHDCFGRKESAIDDDQVSKYLIYQSAV